MAAPTAMPSGMLCTVIANISINVPLLFVLFFEDVTASVKSIKITPVKKPEIHGSHSGIDSFSARVQAGMSSDQTAAAVIIPAEKPVMTAFVPTVVFLFRPKRAVAAAPSEVPTNGSSIPAAISGKPIVISNHLFPIFLYMSNRRFLCICIAKTSGSIVFLPEKIFCPHGISLENSAFFVTIL